MRASADHPVQQLVQVGAKLGGTGAACLVARRDDQVDGRQRELTQPEGFAHDAPDAIARDRVTDGARGDGEPEPWMAEAVARHHCLEQGLSVTLPALVDMIELRLVAEALAGTESERPDRISAVPGRLRE